MNAEELADPVKFTELHLETMQALDDEAIVANASWIVGKGEEYLGGWYDRLAASIPASGDQSGGDAGKKS